MLKLTLIHILRAVYEAIKWVVNGVRTHKFQTAIGCCVALVGLNIWQLVYYKTERIKVEQKCDSLYTKSLATKSYYDRGYRDGLRYNYNFK